MKTIVINSKGSKVKYNLPTTKKEFESCVKKIVSGFTIADNYSLIAIGCKLGLGELALLKENKDINTEFIYVGGGQVSNPVNQTFTNSNPQSKRLVDSLTFGDRVAISKTGITLALQAYIRQNELSLTKFRQDIADDGFFYKNIVKDDDGVKCWFCEFKIVANSEILGIYNDLEKPLKICREVIMDKVAGEA